MHIVVWQTHLKHLFVKAFFVFLISAICGPLHANELLGSNHYIGTWQTTRVHHQFTLARTIMFELWKSPDGTPEGVGIFMTPHGACWGEMSFNDTTGKLQFKSSKSKTCKDLNGGHFNVLRPFGGQVAMLTFVPEGAKDTPQLGLTNTASYRRLKESPPQLKALVSGARKGGPSVEENIQQSLTAHAEQVTQLRDSITQEFQPYFSESHLIGVWRGNFVDKLKNYPAEIAMWSIKDASLYKIGGVVVFHDEHCPKAVTITDTKSQLTWSMSSIQLSQPTDPCKEIHAAGPLALSPDKNTLAINVRVSPQSQNSMNTNNCLQHLPDMDSPQPCGIAGIFQHSSASDRLNKAMSTIQWNYKAKGPEEGHWKLLKRNDSSRSKLVAAHNARLKKNEQFYATLEKNLVAAEKKREEERRMSIAKRLAQIAADAERRARIKREWAARQSGKPYDDTQLVELPPLPTVEGPFTELRGGNFLNALYQGDFAAISQFDAHYRQRKIQQRRAWIGKHWTDDLLDAVVNSMRLADTVLTIYLFYFEDKYATCLKPDAVTFRVVKVVPDTVIENLLGVEVVRYYGWTERKYFKINKDFTIAFRRIGTTEPESAMASLSDFLLNQGGTDLRREVLAGTKQMMNSFSCESKAIQRLEKTLLAFRTR